MATPSASSTSAPVAGYSLQLTIDTAQAQAQINQYRNTLAGLASGTSGASTSNTQFVNGIRLIGTSAVTSAGGIRSLTQAANNNTAATNANTQAANANARANAAAGASAGSHAAGMSQLGAQFQDVAVQAQMGTDPLRILAMQGGQVASAMSLMAGTAGRVGTFLAGPWGVAIMVGVSVLGGLVQALMAAEKEMEALEVASDNLGQAQGILGKMFDLSTGKIINNTAALRNNIQMQMVAMEQKSIIARQEASAKLAESGLGRTTPFARFTSRATAYFTGNPLYINATERAIAAREASGRNLEELGVGVAQGGIEYEDASNILRARRDKGQYTQEEYFAADEFLMRSYDQRTATQASKDMLSALRTGTLPDGYLRPEDNKPKARSGKDQASELNKLKQLGESAAERIQRINEAFDEQPKLVDKVNQATRELDGIIKDVSEKKPPNFLLLIDSAKKAKQVVQEALLKPFNDMVQASERQLKMNSLILAGREDEAEALQRIYQLQDKVGVVTSQQRETILRNVEAERQMNDVLARRQTYVNAYSTAIGDIRSQLESMLSGNFDGNPLKALQQTFKNLNGKIMTEKLFGPMLRELEDYVKKETGIQSAVDIMKEGTTDAGNAATNLATTMNTAAAAITSAANAIAGVAAKANGVVTSEAAKAAGASIKTGATGMVERLKSGAKTNAEMYGDIVVTGSRAKSIKDLANTNKPGVDTVKIGDFADRAAKGLTSPITDELKALLGDKLGSQIGDAMSGALAGYIKAGKPGAVIGGLQGITKGIKGLEGVTKHLGTAMEGAEYGSKVAQMGKMVWSKFSTQGSQIGGSIGALTGLPGGKLIGSILGGTIGGLLKKAKTGSQGFNFDGSGKLVLGSVGGNNGKFKAAAADAGNNVISGLYSIASKLGADLSSINMASIGIRDGKWRVDPDGSGDTKVKKGAVDFGKDGESAAIAYVIKDALKKGVLTGISEFAARIVKTGEDAMIDLAAKYEGVLSELDEMKDPMGSALRKVTEQVNDMVKAMQSAGATASDLAKVEEYRGLKLSKIFEEQTASLMDFRKALDGEGSGVTKLNQLAAKQAEFNAMRSDIAAGKTVDQDKYTDLGQTIFGLARDVWGTATSEFQSIRSDLIGVTDGLISNARSEYEKATAEATKQTATNTAVTADYMSQMLEIMRAGGGMGGASYNQAYNMMLQRSVNGGSGSGVSLL